MLLCLVGMGASSEPASPTTQPTLARSAHYEIRGDVDRAWAREMGRMLDRAYERLGQLLGRSPKGRTRLVVNLFRQPRERDAAVGGRLEAGGLFAYDNHECYLSLQPTNYFTRHLLLHEATHQFVCEAFGRQVDPLPAWLSEGLAETVGHHNWDGSKLRTGQVDVITVPGNDRLARCKELLEASELRARKIVASDGTDRAACWALVHVLLTEGRYRPLLDRYVQRCLQEPDGREPDAEQAIAWFDAVFGPAADRLQKDLAHFITTSSRSWRVVTIHWQQRGNHILGEADGRYAWLVSNRHADCRGKRITVTLASEDWSGTTAGIVIGYVSSRDYRLIELVEGRLLHAFHVTRGLKRDEQVQRLSEPRQGAGEITLTVQCTDDAIQIWLDGEAVWRIPLTEAMPAGALGLTVYRGQAIFKAPAMAPASQTAARSGSRRAGREAVRELEIGELRFSIHRADRQRQRTRR